MTRVCCTSSCWRTTAPTTPAAIARSAGATVYERFNNVQVGKGYALQTPAEHIRSRTTPPAFDGYIVFDADNILDPGYIAAMNRTFSQGYDIVTSYRNSKNYGDNWISAGYALWFLRESRYLNHARMPAGYQLRRLRHRLPLPAGPCWRRPAPGPSILLTEDIQFSVHEILQGRKVGLRPRRRPLRRAAHHLPPVMAAADALVSGLSAGVP